MIEDLIRKFKMIVLDGPLATELERKGCDLEDPLWSAKVLLENPSFIRDVHLDYFRAGADVAVTASYQASMKGFMDRGLSERKARELIYLSIRLAGEARDEFIRTRPHTNRRPEAMLAGSVGSYGAYLADGSEYGGHFSLTIDELKEFHRPRMSILCDRNRSYRVDFLAMETIPCMKEAKALVSLLRDYPHMTSWLCFSARDGTFNCLGEPIEEAAAWLDRQEQIFAVGINCTHPKHITSLVKNMRRATGKPIVVYPNSGETYVAESGGWQGSVAGLKTTGLFDEWYRNGVRLIGGCCRTDPQLIKEIAIWRDRIDL